MTPKKLVHSALRKTVRTTPTYNALRRAGTLWTLAAKRPHERDYLAFPLIAQKTGTFVDIGANAGQTAAAVARLLPRHQIFCVEPNPALQSELAWLQRLVGPRMIVRQTGLGETDGELTLHVPMAGDLAFEARASVVASEAQAHADMLAEQLGRDISLATETITIGTLDGLGVVPDIIKIDVEGFEASVLRGGLSTIAEHQPVILLESNQNDAACKAILGDLGYQFRSFDHAAKRFQKTTDECLNFFAFPEARLPIV